MQIEIYCPHPLSFTTKAYMNTDVKTLIPDMYNITVKIKVLDLLVSLETKHEKSKTIMDTSCL